MSLGVLVSVGKLWALLALQLFKQVVAKLLTLQGLKVLELLLQLNICLLPVLFPGHFQRVAVSVGEVRLLLVHEHVLFLIFIDLLSFVVHFVQEPFELLSLCLFGLVLHLLLVAFQFHEALDFCLLNLELFIPLMLSFFLPLFDGFEVLLHELLPLFHAWLSSKVDFLTSVVCLFFQELLKGHRDVLVAFQSVNYFTL